MADSPYFSFPTSSAGQSPAAAYALALALSRTGVSGTDKNFGFYFDDFEKTNASLSQSVGWLTTPAGGGSYTTRNANTNGGVASMTTGAVAGGTVDQAALSNLISDLSGQKWHYACRMAVTTTITAQTTALMGLLNVGGNTIMAGVFGGASGGTVNFKMQYDGAFIGSALDLAVAINTGFNIFEIYSKGESANKLYARCNEGPEIGPVVAVSNPTTGVYPYNRLANGTDNAARTMTPDWISVLFPR